MFTPSRCIKIPFVRITYVERNTKENKGKKKRINSKIFKILYKCKWAVILLNVYLHNQITNEFLKCNINFNNFHITIK